jgi:hypothetical protein
MRSCYETSSIYVDIGHPLALLSVLFAIFVGCGCGGSLNNKINLIFYFFRAFIRGDLLWPFAYFFLFLWWCVVFLWYVYALISDVDLFACCYFLVTYFWRVSSYWVLVCSIHYTFHHFGYWFLVSGLHASRGDVLLWRHILYHCIFSVYRISHNS